MSNHISFEDRFFVYPIWGLAGSFHLLFDSERRKAVLIDTGLIGEMPRLAAILRELSLPWSEIEAILLTHGHLDHAGNLARFKELTGGPIFAHPAEQAHLDGTCPYRGPARLCGVMEAVGRVAFRYRTAQIDEALAPAMDLPFWGGLSVVHLPGHTEGHGGFYSRRLDLLFSGDLFASYWFSTHLPPFFLNSCPEKLKGSLREVQQLSPRGIIPNHYQGLDPKLHRQKFNALLQRHGLVQ